jgi:hypothetical protein
MYANLDRLGQVDKIGPLVQPVAYGSAHLESSGWSDLIRRKGKWLIDPKFEPRYRVPKFLRPRQNHVIRIILDSCIFEGREEAILNFVDRFDGDVQLTSLPEIESEVKFGRGGSARKVWYDKIMLRKPSTRVLKKEVLATTKPTFYGDSSRPIAGPYLAADLGIRYQLGLIIEGLERTMRGKTLIVLFVTQDYGCGELMRAIGPKSSLYIALRVDVDETGQLFQEIVFDQMRPNLHQ